jgi:hypothetical protein
MEFLGFDIGFEKMKTILINPKDSGSKKKKNGGNSLQI